MQKRTNIVLDEELVEEARRCAGGGTKRELVELALREFVEIRKRRDLRELRGRVRLRSGYDHKRLRKGTADDTEGIGDGIESGKTGD